MENIKKQLEEAHAALIATPEDDRGRHYDRNYLVWQKWLLYFDWINLPDGMSAEFYIPSEGINSRAMLTIRGKHGKRVAEVRLHTVEPEYYSLQSTTFQYEIRGKHVPLKANQRYSRGDEGVKRTKDVIKASEQFAEYVRDDTAQEEYDAASTALLSEHRREAARYTSVVTKMGDAPLLIEAIPQDVTIIPYEAAKLMKAYHHCKEQTQAIARVFSRRLRELVYMYKCGTDKERAVANDVESNLMEAMKMIGWQVDDSAHSLQVYSFSTEKYTDVWERK